jgi:hypothetical protein
MNTVEAIEATFLQAATDVLGNAGLIEITGKSVRITDHAGLPACAMPIALIDG